MEKSYPPVAIAAAPALAPAPALSSVLPPPTPVNKREEANDKMNERHLIGQCVQNPFLAKNDYTRDIELQGNYLRPRNTSTTEVSTPTVLARSHALPTTTT